MELENKTTKAIMDAIIDFWQKNHYSPSIREIMSMTGVNSTSLVRHHIRKLASVGLIEYEPRTARSIRPSNLIINVFIERRL